MRGGDALDVGGADAASASAPAPRAGTTVAAGAGSLARAGAGAPLGSLITVPASSTPSGSRPFIAAIASGHAGLAASAERVARAHL